MPTSAGKTAQIHEKNSDKDKDELLLCKWTAQANHQTSSSP